MRLPLPSRLRFDAVASAIPATVVGTRVNEWVRCLRGRARSWRRPREGRIVIELAVELVDRVVGRDAVGHARRWHAQPRELARLAQREGLTRRPAEGRDGPP